MGTTPEREPVGCDPGSLERALDSGSETMQVIVVRDPRESLKKCSLTPLRGMPGVRFVSYHPELRLPVEDCILLHPDGPQLAQGEEAAALVLVDCSWRRVDTLLRTLVGGPRRRSLAGLESAYPRKSRTFADPPSGLASVEALYAALARLGHPRPELLAEYRWREAFLEANPELPR